MLQRLARYGAIRQRLLPIIPRHNFRLFCFSQRNLNEKGKESPEEKPKTAERRPLSRVAIGGSKSKKGSKKNTIEFTTWKAVILLLVVGGAASYWFTKEKEKLRIQREAEARRGYGKPMIGGEFRLVDTENRPFTHENLKNEEKKFSIIYFGFTHCPDVCPEELDKLGDMLNQLEKDNISIQPIFITCDPVRDTPEVVKEYLKDFHPSIIGLTGSYESVKNACKKYRVYFSSPPNVKPGQDYLVDHSIFYYLMDPEGNFVNVIGRDADTESAVARVKEQVDAYVPLSVLEERKSSWLGFLYK